MEQTSNPNSQSVPPSPDVNDVINSQDSSPQGTLQQNIIPPVTNAMEHDYQTNKMERKQIEYSNRLTFNKYSVGPTELALPEIDLSLSPSPYSNILYKDLGETMFKTKVKLEEGTTCVSLLPIDFIMNEIYTMIGKFEFPIQNGHFFISTPLFVFFFWVTGQGFINIYEFNIKLLVQQEAVDSLNPSINGIKDSISSIENHKRRKEGKEESK